MGRKASWHGALCSRSAEREDMKKVTMVLIAILILAPAAARARDLWYSTEEQARINAQLDHLQKLNDALQQKVDQIQVAPAPQIIERPDNSKIEQQTARIDQVEARVGVLEQTVQFLQSKISAALDTTIGLLKKLLKK